MCGAKSAKSGLQEHFIPRTRTHVLIIICDFITYRTLFFSFFIFSNSLSSSFQFSFLFLFFFLFSFFVSSFILAELVPIELVTNQCCKTNKKIKPGNHIVTLVQKGVKEVQIYTIFIFVFLVISFYYLT